jgi:regulator of sirC expression with transglutaminase-like and TPR domain
MDLSAALARLSRDPHADFDVAELALELAKDEYSHLDVDGYLGELAALAHEARSYINGNLEKRVSGLCRLLFHELGFRGNRAHYYDPRNSHLNEVLDRRTGIPITLSMVAMAIGARAGLRIVGVNLPGHFIAKAVEPGREVLFDPFDEGRLLAPGDCVQLVERTTGKPFRATPQRLAPTPLSQILVRMLNNLKAIYLGQEDFVRAIRVIDRLRQLSPNEAVHIRDLGLVFLRSGRPAKAIDHLSTYLGLATSAEDRQTIARLLEEAQRTVAQWN